MKIVRLLIIMVLVSCNSQKPDRNKDLSSLPDINSNFNYDLSNDSIVEEITYDINSDNLVDTIYLLNPQKYDPGQYTKIFISLTSLDTFSLVNIDAWDIVKDIKIENEISSDLIIINRNLKQSFILLFGYQYGCCPQRLTILGVSDNEIKTIFNDDFDLYEVSDIDEDDNIEIIGRKTFVQYTIDSTDFEMGNYVPFHVYTLKPNKVQANEDLAKQYNIENYVFAGYWYSEDIIVCYPKDNSKPYLLNKSDHYRCNTDYLLTIHENFESLKVQEVNDFLMTFHERCSNNIEYSEWSSELLLQILENYPDLLIQALQEDSDIKKNLIFKKIKSPLHDLVNYDTIQNRMKDIPESEMKLILDSLINIAYDMY